MNPYSPAEKITQTASQVRDLKKEKFMRTERLLRNWKPPDLHEECEKEINELKATLDELVEAYEMMALTGNRKAFNDALHRAKKLINY